MRLFPGIASSQTLNEASTGLTLVEIGADISPDPTYSLVGSTHSITSGGGSNSTENFAFAFTTIPIVDCQVTARISNPDTSDYIDHMGVCIRNENTVNPVAAEMLLRYLTSGTYYQYGYGRRRADLPWQGYASAGAIGSSMSSHQWLRLTLTVSSATVAYQYSSDGINWNTQGTAIFLDESGGDAWDKGGTIRLGMTVSARGNTIEFDNFTAEAT